MTSKNNATFICKMKRGAQQIIQIHYNTKCNSLSWIESKGTKLLWRRGTARTELALENLKSSHFGPILDSGELQS
jgi:hypothetical protein